MVEEYQNLIYSIIHKNFYFSNNREDLFQVGYIGLEKALRSYDASQGVKFSTYAYKWIYGEMYAYLNRDRIIKQSSEMMKLYLKINKVKALLCQKLMHEPTSNEIATYLDLDVRLVNEALIESSATLSLDDVNPRYDNNIIDNIALKDELEKLNHDEYEIIEKRYLSNLTQQETAKILGLSQVQVSRKEQKIISKLKNNLLV